MSKRHRRRSSNGSKQHSPEAATKKVKVPNTPAASSGGSSSQNLIQRRTSIGNRSITGQAGSTITEAETAENHSEMEGFGDDGQADDFDAPINLQPRNLTSKFPPLVVKNIPLGQLKKNLKEKVIDVQFKLTRMGIKIVVNSKQSFDATKAYLNRAKAEFYTHDVPEDKPFKAVIRGLPIMDKEDITLELVQRYKLQPVAIHVIARKFNEGNFRDCLYLIHFRKGTTTLNALKAVRSISDMIVSWEAYRGSHRDVTQCMRCMNFGHGTRNCNLQPRCNICAHPHITSECHHAEEAVFKCVNCGGSHRASDKSCPMRETYKQIRKEAASRNLPGRRAPADRQLFRQEEFPALQPSISQHQHVPPSWFGRTSESVPHITALNPMTQQQRTSRTWHENTRPSAPSVTLHHPTNPQVSANAPTSEGESIPQDIQLYSPEELVKIFLVMSSKLKCCRTRHEQVETLGVFLIQYGQ